jgi:hypothetical protein
VVKAVAMAIRANQPRRKMNVLIRKPLLRFTIKDVNIRMAEITSLFRRF